MQKHSDNSGEEKGSVIRAAFRTAAPFKMHLIANKERKKKTNRMKEREIEITSGA